VFPALQALCALGTTGIGDGTYLAHQHKCLPIVPVFHDPAPRDAVTSILLPEGATPMNSPRWVPRAIQRVTTISPSATCFSTVKLMSGKAEWYARTRSLMASGPRLSSGSGGMADVIWSQ
jgi:hypothetical protein